MSTEAKHHFLGLKNIDGHHFPGLTNPDINQKECINSFVIQVFRLYVFMYV